MCQLGPFHTQSNRNRCFSMISEAIFHHILKTVYHYVPSCGLVITHKCSYLTQQIHGVETFSPMKILPQRAQRQSERTIWHCRKSVPRCLEHHAVLYSVTDAA